ncbi:hypothetical protein [Desulfobacula toluolica]|uniref:Conserved uncharacterized protein n=1 Tax=Desulfobacula toluolica (strain DSM 7467 / Tol2) TaxID=651182 RepID=K0NQD4_DESTT|nr:hypothetical protein [Desulfobacula toluolica]CCK81102.1 conserved uncharacterized protein [Desulfobacula toluolica Tol2]
MNRTTDIRDRAYLSGSQVQSLNFIKDSGRYIFRKFYRSGLRSHIFEVIRAEDVLKETQGEITNGIRLFPRAKPLKIFRILRTRFKNKAAVFNEIKKYNLLFKFMGPELIAQSEEFIVDYTGTGKSRIILCGLQEYIEGEILDPWRIFGKNYLIDLFKSTQTDESQNQAVARKARNNIAKFVKRIRHMIDDTRYIPDLAGIGNLILTRDGDLKLVDINNIVEIKLDDNILIDDKGYPSCDVSVEVLSILERNILQKDIQTNDPLYRFFLSSERKKKVKALEKKFYKNLENRLLS